MAVYPISRIPDPVAPATIGYLRYSAHMARSREDGFTLIELMVVVLIIGVLIAIALPTFLGARARAQDRAASSDLRNAVSAGIAIYTDKLTYTGVDATAMNGSEPSLTFVDAATASTAGNNYSPSFRVYNYGEINVARLSASGSCYYIRNIQAQGPAASDVPGTYYGHYVGTCTGNAIAAYGTSTTNFGGW